MAKIVQLDTAALSPRTLLHQLLERADEIECLLIVSIDKDASVLATWSNCRAEQLAMMAMYSWRACWRDWDAQAKAEEQDPEGAG